MFRISRGDSGFDADTLERARETLRDGKPGRYHVDEIRAEPFPSGHTSRRGESGSNRRTARWSLGLIREKREPCLRLAGCADYRATEFVVKLHVQGERILLRRPAQ